MYVADDKRYDFMQYRRSGRSGIKLPAISLGLWHNFGGVDNFENSRAMLRRAFDPVNRADAFMFRNFFVINGMHRVEIAKRDYFPLGDPAWNGPLLKAA